MNMYAKVVVALLIGVVSYRTFAQEDTNRPAVQTISPGTGSPTEAWIPPKSKVVIGVMITPSHNPTPARREWTIDQLTTAGGKLSYSGRGWPTCYITNRPIKFVGLENGMAKLIAFAPKDGAHHACSTDDVIVWLNEKTAKVTWSTEYEVVSVNWK